jgi:hypothetical protein
MRDIEEEWASAEARKGLNGLLDSFVSSLLLISSFLAELF